MHCKVTKICNRGQTVAEAMGYGSLSPSTMHNGRIRFQSQLRLLIDCFAQVFSNFYNLIIQSIPALFFKQSFLKLAN